MHPKDDETYPLGALVRIKKTGEFGRLDKVVFRFEGKCFSHYSGPIDGRTMGNWAMFHDDIDVIFTDDHPLYPWLATFKYSKVEREWQALR